MMSVNPNVYNRRYGGSSHDYDTIPEVLAEMQVNMCDTPLLVHCERFVLVHSCVCYQISQVAKLS